MASKPTARANSTKVVRLVPKVPTDDRAYMLKRFDEEVKEMRDFLKEGKIPGFGLIAYDRIKEDGVPAFATLCRYFTTDPADGYLLPDVAKTALYKRIHED